MSTSSDRAGAIPTGLIAILIAALGGIWLVQRPLESHRPVEETAGETPPQRRGLVETRLWQEPFHYVREYLDAADMTGASPEEKAQRSHLWNVVDELRLAIAERRRHRPENRILPLFVLVPGGEYSHDIERRRRERYALITALTRYRFDPQQFNKIGYLLTPRLRASDLAEHETPSDLSEKSDLGYQASDTAIIAYEWFQIPTQEKRVGEYSRENKRTAKATAEAWRDDVLVFWIRNDAFATLTLMFVEEFLRYLDPLNTVEPVVVGPSDSGALRSLLQLDLPDGRQPYTEQEMAAMRERYRQKLGDWTNGNGNGNRVEQADNEESTEESGDDPSPAAPDPVTSVGLVVEPNPADAMSEFLRRLEFSDRILAAIAAESGDSSFIENVDESFRGCIRRLDQDSLSPAEADRIFAGCLVDSDMFARVDSGAFVIRERLAKNSYPTNLASVLDAVSSSRWSESLMLEADFYLDVGLSQPVIPGTIDTCVVKGLTPAIQKRTRPDADLQFLARTRLAECLSSYFKLEDQDPDWASTVALIWLEKNRQWLEWFLESQRDHPAIANAGTEGIRGDQKIGAVAPKVHVISHRSTVPFRLLLHGSRKPYNVVGSLDEQISDQLGAKQFVSVLRRDDEVLSVVLRELWERGLRSLEEVAVLTELDSFYGRAMPEGVARAFCEIPEMDSDNSDSYWDCQMADSGSSVSVAAGKIQSYGYLRGVDGETLGVTTDRSGKQDSSDGNMPSTSLLSLTTSYRERASGSAQLDYVRRLADRIAAMGGETRLKAIGVFGSDIYDKQLLIHALHDRLPNLVFFTTDLDARLFDPREFGWNRNLLVGSSLPLDPYPETLEDRLGPQFESAPFRDHYQTAMFRAVSFVLEGCTNVPETGKPCSAEPPMPRLYEIGRSGAIDITPPLDLYGAGSAGSASSASSEGLAKAVAGAAVSTSHANVPMTEANVGPPGDGPRGWERHAGAVEDIILETVILGLPLLLLAGFGFYCWRWLPPHFSNARKISFIQVAIIGSVAVIALFGARWLWADDSTEPWLLFEGISSIPAVVLHCTVVIYAIALFLLTRGRTTDMNVGIARKFGFAQPADLERGFGENRRVSWSISKWDQSMMDRIANKEDIPITEIWTKYCELWRIRARVARALPLTIPLLIFIYWALGQQSIPLVAREINVMWFEFAAAGFALIVIMLSADALHLVQVVMKIIGQARTTEWPELESDYLDGLDEAIEKKWRKMKLVVDLSECIGPLLIQPFVLLFLLVLSRTTIAEGWVWTGALVLFYLVFGGYLLARAVLFQMEASKTKQRILQELRRYRYELCLKQDEKQVGLLDDVVEDIDGIHSGAFVHWTRHPIMASIALPSSGIGLLSVLNVW